MKAYLLGAVPLFSDLTFLYCLFLFLTHYTADVMMVFSFPALLLFGLAGLALNRLLLKKRAQVWVFALVNGGLILGAEVALFLLPNNVAGFFAYLFAGLCFAYPAIRSFTLAYSPPKDSTLLTYVEISFGGTAAFLFIQIAEFAPGAGPTVLCLVALGLNIVTLAWLRGAGAAKTRIDTGTKRQPVLILALVALGLIAVVAVVAVVGLVVLPASASSLVAAAGAVAGGLAWVWGHIWQFFLLVGRWIVWLISLLPGAGEAAALAGEEMGALAGGEVEAGELSAWVGMLLPGIALAVVLVVVIIFVVRHRRMRLAAGGGQEAFSQQKSGAPTLWQLLLAALRRLAGKLAFLRALAVARGTPAGVAVRLELLCARRGAPRGPGQTPREFLLTLYNKTPPEGELARAGFLALADAVDRRCFGGGENEKNLPRGQVRAMMRAALAASTRRKKRLIAARAHPPHQGQYSTR